MDSYNSKVKLPEPKTFPNVKLIESVPRHRPTSFKSSINSSVIQPIMAPPPYPSKPQHTEKLDYLEHKDIHFGWIMTLRESVKWIPKLEDDIVFQMDSALALQTTYDPQEMYKSLFFVLNNEPVLGTLLIPTHSDSNTLSV